MESGEGKAALTLLAAAQTSILLGATTSQHVYVILDSNGFLQVTGKSNEHYIGVDEALKFLSTRASERDRVRLDDAGDIVTFIREHLDQVAKDAP